MLPKAIWQNVVFNRPHDRESSNEVGSKMHFHMHMHTFHHLVSHTRSPAQAHYIPSSTATHTNTLTARVVISHTAQRGTKQMDKTQKVSLNTSLSYSKKNKLYLISYSHTHS